MSDLQNAVASHGRAHAMVYSGLAFSPVMSRLSCDPQLHPPRAQCGPRRSPPPSLRRVLATLAHRDSSSQWGESSWLSRILLLSLVKVLCSVRAPCAQSIANLSCVCRHVGAAHSRLAPSAPNTRVPITADVVALDAPSWLSRLLLFSLVVVIWSARATRTRSAPTAVRPRIACGHPRDAPPGARVHSMANAT